jgi:hypothetical protein
MARMSVQMNNVVPLKKGWKWNKEDFYMNITRKPSVFGKFVTNRTVKSFLEIVRKLKMWMTNTLTSSRVTSNNKLPAGWLRMCRCHGGERSRRFGGMCTETTAPSIGTFITGESKQMLDKVFGPATYEHQKTYRYFHCSSFLYSTTKYHQITWILHTVTAAIMNVSVRACVHRVVSSRLYV